MPISNNPVIPRITFGIIVLNGEPFTRYNLRSLYPWAHQIIVVEGACKSAAANSDTKGHSKDGTLDVLRLFQEKEDTEKKIKIITAEDEGYLDGFWPGEKNEMSQVYAKNATGDYIWQIDVDEFYREQDIKKVLMMLCRDSSITAVSFRTYGFWGCREACLDGYSLRDGARDFHRLFKWGEGYCYTTHRPPTVVDKQGRDLRNVRHITAKQMSTLGIFMYHYLFVFPFQVRAKNEYYGKMSPELAAARNRWVENYFSLKDPFFICSTSLYGEPSWLVPFHGDHPSVIKNLFDCVNRGELKMEVRCTDDIYKLLKSPMYRFKKKHLLLLWFFRDKKRKIIGIFKKMIMNIAAASRWVSVY